MMIHIGVDGLNTIKNAAIDVQKNPFKINNKNIGWAKTMYFVHLYFQTIPIAAIVTQAVKIAVACAKYRYHLDVGSMTDLG